MTDIDVIEEVWPSTPGYDTAECASCGIVTVDKYAAICPYCGGGLA